MYNIALIVNLKRCYSYIIYRLLVNLIRCYIYIYNIA